MFMRTHAAISQPKRRLWRYVVLMFVLVGCTACTQDDLSCEALTELCLSKLRCPGEREGLVKGCGCICAEASMTRTVPKGAASVSVKASKSSQPKVLQETNVDRTKANASRREATTSAAWQKALPLTGAAVSIPVDALPPAERVFALDEDGDGVDELFGSIGQTLWRYSVKGSTVRRESYHGSGTVQRMMVGTWMGQRHVFLAKGRGRGVKGAVSVQLRPVHALAFQSESLYGALSKRNDVNGLSLVSSRGAMRGGVLLTSFVSKYDVRSLLIGPEPHLTVFHEPQRMAMNVLPWNVGQGGGLYKVVGRIYGDARGEPGDLKLAPLGVPIPTDGKSQHFT